MIRTLWALRPQKLGIGCGDVPTGPALRYLVSAQTVRGGIQVPRRYTYLLAFYGVATSRAPRSPWAWVS